MLGFALIQILAMVPLGSLTWWACSRMDYFKPKKCTDYDSNRDDYYTLVKEGLNPPHSIDLIESYVIIEDGVEKLKRGDDITPLRPRHFYNLK